MRLTTDVLADDGSAAMTAVSSASLALINAGVQLSAPVAGLPQCITLACILCSQVYMTEKPFTCNWGSQRASSHTHWQCSMCNFPCRAHIVQA